MTAESSDTRLFERVARRVDADARLLRAWPLTGGYSARVTALELERPDETRQKVIVRQHGAVDLANNPHIATDEYKLLGQLKQSGLPVPQPYLADETGAIFPTPYIVVEFVEGVADFAPADLSGYLRQAAEALARIHQVTVLESLAFLLPQNALYLPFDARAESAEEGEIRARLAAACPLTQSNPNTLLHGDFWPGNLLWNDGRLAAVIDWEDAALGDPLADLANARLEILWAFGEAAMNDFTAHYQQQMPALDYANLPCWALYKALRPISKLAAWGLDAATEARMRERLGWFVNQALDSIG